MKTRKVLPVLWAVTVFAASAGLVSSPAWAQVPAVGPGECKSKTCCDGKPYPCKFDCRSLPACGGGTHGRGRLRPGSAAAIRQAHALARERARVRAVLLHKLKLEEERYRKRRAVTRLQLERAQRVIDQRAKDIRELFGTRHAELLGRLHNSAYGSWDTPPVYLAGRTRVGLLRKPSSKPYPKDHICHRYAEVPTPSIGAGGAAQDQENPKRTIYELAAKLGPDAIDVLSSVFLTSNPVGMTVKAVIEVSKSANVAADAASKVVGRKEAALLLKIKNKGGRLTLGFARKLQQLKKQRDQKSITPEKYRELVDLEKARFDRNYRALVGAGRSGRVRQPEYFGMVWGAVFNAEVGWAVVNDLRKRYSPMSFIAKHTVGKVGGKFTGALVKKAKRYATGVVKKLDAGSPLSRIRRWRKLTGMVTETPISKIVGRGEDWVKDLATPSDLKARPKPQHRPAARAVTPRPAAKLFPRCGHTGRR
jgi:hypothetical protein